MPAATAMKVTRMLFVKIWPDRPASSETDSEPASGSPPRPERNSSGSRPMAAGGSLRPQIQPSTSGTRSSAAASASMRGRSVIRCQ